MINLQKLLRSYENTTDCLNSWINLLGYLNDTTLITKSGDLVKVWEVDGIDYEAFERENLLHTRETIAKARLLLDERITPYEIYERRSGEVPELRETKSEILNECNRRRRAYFEAKKTDVYGVKVHVVAVWRSRLSMIRERPTNLFYSAVVALTSAFTLDRKFIRRQWASLIDHLSVSRKTRIYQEQLLAEEEEFSKKLAEYFEMLKDLTATRLLKREESFGFFYHLINPDPAVPPPPAPRFWIDFHLANSHIDIHDEYLRIDGKQYVRVLTMKETTGDTIPLVLEKLLHLDASIRIVTEWQRIDSFVQTKKISQARRHHFHTSKSVSAQVEQESKGKDSHELVNEGKKEAVRELGQALADLEFRGKIYGQFSLTVVLTDNSPENLEETTKKVRKVFQEKSGVILPETVNLFNAFLAAIPGGMRFNYRYLEITNKVAADYTLLLKIGEGERWNEYLKDEYLAVVESQYKTLVYINFYEKDLGHTLAVGPTRKGKSYLSNFVVTNIQKYVPYIFSFEVGESQKALCRLFGGRYYAVTRRGTGVPLNPYGLADSPAQRQFLHLFTEGLLTARDYQLTDKDDRDVWDAIDQLYSLPERHRHLSGFLRLVPRHLAEILLRWTRGNQFGHFFDNDRDEFEFARYTLCEFSGMDQYPLAVTPLTLYLNYRMDQVINDPTLGDVLKVVNWDELWRFLLVDAFRDKFIEGLRTWAKKRTQVIFWTQNVSELDKTERFDMILESCATKLFFPNPQATNEKYQKMFQLSGREVEIIRRMIPQKQFYMVKGGFRRICNLNTDPFSHLVYVSDPSVGKRRDELMETMGAVAAIETIMAESKGNGRHAEEEETAEVS